MVRRTKFNRYLIIQQGAHVWGVHSAGLFMALVLLAHIYVSYVDRVLVALAVIDNLAAPMAC